MIDDHLDEAMILVKIKEATQDMNDINSGKAKQKLKKQITELKNILSEKSDPDIEDLRFELDKAVDVLRIFRMFLNDSPETIIPEDKFFRDSSASFGQGLYKIMDDLITAYDAFMTRYHQQETHQTA